MKRRIAVVVTLVLASTHAASAAGLTDTVDAASAGDRVVTAGTVSVETVGDFVGGHDMRCPAFVVKSAGSSITYDLAVEPGKPITIEVEELDGRQRDVRGYLVYVDGVKRYFRTWQGCGAGPLHYFVDAPPATKDRVRVRLESVTDAPFAVARVWAFSDFDRYFDGEKLAVPYHIAPPLWLSWKDRADDVRRVRQIKDSLGDHPNVRPAWTCWLSYAVWDPAVMAERIDYALSIARELDMPVQLCFDSWWANTPTGPDGKDGFWTDVRYQQVVWNETTRTMQLSVPNRWSSTPWLTVTHPDLNAFKASRVKAAAGHLARRYRELSADGKQHLILAINLDNEPVYWASGNAGLGSDLLWADFNPTAVAAAKADGVTLDPVDGVSTDERRWLCTNLLRYNDLIGRSVVEGLGRDATVVTARGATASHDLLANNVYTQAMVPAGHEQFPMVDPAWPFWETAAPASVRVGGEWNTDALRERESVLHQLPLGRNAAINAECENNERNFSGVRPGYALGQRYYAPYNYPLDKMHVATSELHDLAQPYPDHVYRRVLVEHHFRDDGWKKLVAHHDGVATGIIGNTPSVAVAPAASDRPGILRYVLTAPAGGFDGLWLELSGRANDFEKHNAEVCIRVRAGRDASSLKPVHTYANIDNIDPAKGVDLGAVARGADRVVVELELDAHGLDPTVLSWVSIHRVRFTTPWPADVTADLHESTPTLATARKRNLLVSWRRDAELAIAKAPAAHAEEARRLYASGSYVDTYHLANAALCQALPATFYLTESGQLGRYPVHVQVTDPVTVVLHSLDNSVPRVTAFGARSGEIHVGVTHDDKNRRTVPVSAYPQPAPPNAPARNAIRIVEGTLTEFQQLTPYAMPRLRLDGRDTAWTLDLAANIHHTGDKPLTPKSTPLGQIPLRTGDRVRVRVDEQLGRVFEVWPRE